jgi:hypothetical protein
MSIQAVPSAGSPASIMRQSQQKYAGQMAKFHDTMWETVPAAAGVGGLAIGGAVALYERHLHMAVSDIHRSSLYGGMIGAVFGAVVGFVAVKSFVHRNPPVTVGAWMAPTTLASRSDPQQLSTEHLKLGRMETGAIYHSRMDAARAGADMGGNHVIVSTHDAFDRPDDRGAEWYGPTNSGDPRVPAGYVLFDLTGPADKPTTYKIGYDDFGFKPDMDEQIGNAVYTMGSSEDAHAPTFETNIQR